MGAHEAQTQPAQHPAALVGRAEALIDRLEQMLVPPPRAIDWKASTAFRWSKRNDAPQGSHREG